MTLRFGIASITLLITLSAASAQAADVVINDEARAHFSAGVNLIQDPDGARYEEAYREFKVAYAASPSWKILGNLGISAMKLERDGEAIEAYKKYLSQGGAQVDAEERAQFQRDLSTLEAGVVRLKLESDPPGASIEDERFPASGSAIRNSYPALTGPASIGVRAGRHRFTAKLPGHAEAVWEIELSPRQQETHVFKLAELNAAEPVSAVEPAPAVAADTTNASAGNGLRIGAYVALGVGVAALGAGTFFALRAKGKYGDANDLASKECGAADPCALEPFGEWKKLGDDGDRAKTFSLVGFIVGGVGVATGVTLFVLSGTKQEPQAARVEPFLGIGSLGVKGSF